MHIKVIRTGPFCYVDRWQDWMRQPLSGTVKRRVESVNDDGKKVAELKKLTVPCYTVNPSTQEVFFVAGLFDRFKEAAAKHQFTVDYVDSRDPNPMTIEPHLDEVPESLRHKQDAAINAIIANDKGIIKCNTGFGKTFIMTVMCLVYRHSKIVITTASKVVVKQTYDSLVKALGSSEVGLLCGGTPSVEDNKRVTVATCASLMRAPLKSCDFFFFDEVHNCGFNATYDKILEMIGNARMFGFTASLDRGDGALDAIKSLFGDVLVSCDYQEAVDHKMVTPLVAVMPKVVVRGRTKVTGIQHVDERVHYWQNSDRNRLIANIAADIPEDQQMIITVKTLEHAIFLKKQPGLEDIEIIHSGAVPRPEKKVSVHTPDTITEPVEAYCESRGVVDVLIPTVVQDSLLFLRQSNNEYISPIDALRFWKVKGIDDPVAATALVPVIIGGVDVATLHKTKKQVANQIERLASGELKRAIATTTIKEGGNFYHLMYIIRADGSPSGILNIQFPGRASRVLESKPAAMIFDPYDDWNDWVKWRAEQRRRYYQKNGWLS